MGLLNQQRWVWLALLVVCFAVAPAGEYRHTMLFQLFTLALRSAHLREVLAAAVR
jgi:hypothetical protein